MIHFLKTKWSAHEVDLSLPFIEDVDNASATLTVLLHEMMLSTWATFSYKLHSVCDTELYGFETGPFFDRLPCHGPDCQSPVFQYS